MDDLTKEDVTQVQEAMTRTSEPPKTPPTDPDGGPKTPEDIIERDATQPPQPTKKTLDPGQISRAQFLQLEEVATATNLPPASLDKLRDLKVNVQVLLGTTKMSLENILKLHQGSVVELDKLAGEPVDITANGRLIAKAEVVVIDGNFGVKIVEISGAGQKLKS